MSFNEAVKRSEQEYEAALSNIYENLTGDSWETGVTDDRTVFVNNASMGMTGKNICAALIRAYDNGCLS